MELEKKITELFKEIGLGEPCTKTYLALIYLGGEATAEQLVTHTGLPPSSIYKALKCLEEHGLVTSVSTKPRKYILVPPDKRLNMLLEEKLRRLIKLSREVSKIIEQSITGLHVSETVLTTIERWEDVVRMIKFMIRTAENEILVYMPKNILYEIAPELSNALDRQVFVNIVASNTLSGRHPRTVYDYSNVSTIVRERPHGTRILVITDSRVSLIAPLTLGDYPTYTPRATYIEDVELGFILTSYFYNRIVASSLEVYSSIKPGDKYVFKNIQSAIDFIRHALRHRYEVYGRVKGYMTTGLSEVEVSGYIYNVVANPSKGIYSILLDSGGYTYSIGGYRAFLEDVMAREIYVEVKTTAIEDLRKIDQVLKTKDLTR